SVMHFLYLHRSAQQSTLLPYTTLFRSEPDHAVGVLAVRGRGGHPLPVGDVVGAVGLCSLVQQVRVFQIGEKVHVSSPVLVRILRSEAHTSELQSRFDLVCRLLLAKKKI